MRESAGDGIKRLRADLDLWMNRARIAEERSAIALDDAERKLRLVTTERDALRSALRDAGFHNRVARIAQYAERTQPK